MGQLIIFKTYIFLEGIMRFWNGANLWSQLSGCTESIL